MHGTQTLSQMNINNKLEIIGNIFKKLFVRNKFIPYQQFELNLRWKPHDEFEKNLNLTDLGEILIFAGGCRDGPYKISIKFYAKMNKEKSLWIYFNPNIKHINVTQTWQGHGLGLNMIFPKEIEELIQKYYNIDPIKKVTWDRPLISIYSLPQFFPDSYTRRRDLYDEFYDENKYFPLLKYVVGWAVLSKLPKNERWVNIKLTIKNETNIGRMDYTYRDYHYVKKKTKI